MSSSPSVEFAAGNLPCERYGLQLIDESAVAAPSTEAPAQGRPMHLFDWGLLSGFVVLQIAHLAVLAVFARWALRGLIGV